jgi:hypothetical protein
MTAFQNCQQDILANVLAAWNAGRHDCIDGQQSRVALARH